MFFLVIGVLLLLMKWQELDPVAGWPWWLVLAPFGLAVAWWTWADMTGYTKRKAMEKENAKKRARIEKNREALGLDVGRKRR